MLADPTTIKEITHFIETITTLNLGYLGLSVTILVFLGGAFYLFNFKPLKETIEKNEKRLMESENKLEGELLKFQDHQESRLDEFYLKTKEVKDKQTEQLMEAERISREFLQATFSEMRKEVKENKDMLMGEIRNAVSDIKKKNEDENNKLKKEIETTSELAIEKINQLAEETDAKIKKEAIDLRKKSNHLELRSIWNEHYMWGAKNVYVNVVDSLIRYLEKGLEYKIDYLFPLCLEILEEELDNVGSDDLEDFYQYLLSVLDKIDKFEEIKIRIKDKAKNILSKK